MKFSFLRSLRFWIPAAVTLAAAGILFAWELNGLEGIGFPSLPRMPPTMLDVTSSVLIALLLSFNAGLFLWLRREGASCPRGAGASTAGAGVLGAGSFLCTACIIAPVSFLGFSVSLAALAPFLPLLQIITVLFLSASAVVLLLRTRQPVSVTITE